MPLIVICDNRKQFIGLEFKKLLAQYNVKVYYTPLYHPQRNAVERTHRTLSTVLRAYISENHRLWDDHLQKVACAIRSSRHYSTNQTPYFINFGREMVLDGTEYGLSSETISTTSTNRAKAFEKLYSDVQKNLRKAFERQQSSCNLRRRDTRYAVGDLVWHKNCGQSKAADYVTAKFLPKYVGPFVVKKILNPWTYELQETTGKSAGVWNAKDLKKDGVQDNCGYL